MGLTAAARGYAVEEQAHSGSTDNTYPTEEVMSGAMDKITGRVKQAAGDLTDNEDLKDEGEKDELAGKVKDKVDDAKDKASDAIDSIKDKFK